MNTGLDDIILCGIPNAPNALAPMYQGETAAVRIASEIFDDDFQSFRSKIFKELDKDLETYEKERNYDIVECM